MAQQRVKFELVEYGDDGRCYFEGRVFTGVAFDTQPNGQIWSEVEHVDGLQEGMAYSWYPSGKLESQQSYWRDGSHGKYFEWFESGRLKIARLDQFGFSIVTKVWNEAGQLVKSNRLRRSDSGYDLWKSLRAQTKDWVPPRRIRNPKPHVPQNDVTNP